MSVATHLGVSDPDRDLLGEARGRWPVWAQEHPTLAVVDDLIELQDWTASVSRTRSDEVLHVLAVLASPSGGDETAAAGALAWVLLPGACELAWRLRTLGDCVDEVVAGQLWLEVRSFRWQRLTKVSSNIILNTRRGVLRDLGVSRRELVWSQTTLVGPGTDAWEVLAEQNVAAVEAPAMVELADVMAWAIEAGVIAERDRDLLVDLALAADDVQPARCVSRGGLFAAEATARVARKWGVWPSTVQRRATNAMAAIGSAHSRLSA